MDLDNSLLEEDIGALAEAVGCDIDLRREGELLGVVVREFPLPAGVYTKDSTDVLLQTTLQYPMSAMDMFWVDADLVLATGAVPAGGESIESHFGCQWRRYSWHRNAPWLPGRDNLMTHFEFVVARLQRPE